MSFPGFGGPALGEVELHGPFSGLESYIQAPTRRRNQTGFGYDHRCYNRAYRFTVAPSTNPGNGGNLTITTLTGAILGTIRTDKQHSELAELVFTTDRNGCADFSLKLLKLPRFALEPFSIVKFNVGNSDFNWYTGAITVPPEPGTDKEPLLYKGFGLRRWLESKQPADGNTVFTVGMDTTEIVQSLVENSIQPFTPIAYDPAKIGDLSGVTLAEDLELSQFPLRKIMDFLQKLTQTPDYYYLWGVDGEGAFFWRRITRTDRVRSIFIGYQMQDFKPQLNYEAIKNKISIHREQETGSGESGFGVVGVFNDPTSIKKYGENELIQKIPGYISEVDGQTYGQALLRDLAEPKTSAKAGLYQALSQGDYFDQGIYRVFMPLGRFRENVSALDKDDASEFAISGTGDLAVFADEDIYVYADGCPRFEFTSALGQSASLQINSKGLVKKVYFYGRSTRAGAFITVGIGKSAWNECTAKIAFPAASQFNTMEIDFSEFNLRDAKYFGFSIDEEFSGATSIWLDKLDFEMVGHKTHHVELNQAVYTYTPNQIEAKTQWGTPSAALVEYVAALQQLTGELQAAGGLK